MRQKRIFRRSDLPIAAIYSSAACYIRRISPWTEKAQKAGAATAVETVYTALEEGVYKVTLDRPFVYAIIDDATGLPVFIGTVTDIGK